MTPVAWTLGLQSGKGDDVIEGVVVDAVDDDGVVDVAQRLVVDLGDKVSKLLLFLSPRRVFPDQSK